MTPQFSRIQFTLGGRYDAEGPSGAPDWGPRFVVALVFPQGKHALVEADGKDLTQ